MAKIEEKSAKFVTQNMSLERFTILC